MQKQSVDFRATQRHRFCSSPRRLAPSGPFGDAATGYTVRKVTRLLIHPSLLRPFPAHLSAAQPNAPQLGAAQLSAAHLDAAQLNPAQSVMGGTNPVFSQQRMETQSKSGCGDLASGGREHTAALSAEDPTAFPAPSHGYSTRIIVKTLCSLMTHPATIRLEYLMPVILFPQCSSSGRSQVKSHA